MSEFSMFGSLLPSEIPELEPLGLRSEIATIRVPGSTERVKALRIYGAGTAEHRGLLEQIGFRFDRSSGTFISDGPVDRRRLLLAFPVEQTVEVPPAPRPQAAPEPATPPVDIQATTERLAATTTTSGLFSPAARPAAPQRAVESANDDDVQPSPKPRPKVAPQAVVIGVNAVDATVYRATSGERFYRVPGDDDVYEDQLDEQPGLFLRAPSKADLVLVGRGLLSPALRGRSLPPDEVERYLSAVNETRSNPFSAQDVVEGAYLALDDVLAAAKTAEQARAIASRLHRFTGQSFAAYRPGNREPFPIANAIRELAPTATGSFIGAEMISAERLADQVVQGRSPDGAGRTLIDITAFGEVAPTDAYIRTILGDLPQNYVIEGIQVLAAPLVEDHRLMISIGARRPQAIDMQNLPAAVFQAGYATEPEALSVWLDGVESANAAAEQWFEAIRNGEVKADTVETIEQNRWQVPARPLSTSGRPTMMTPVNLKNALDEAQRNFMVRHPEGADEYVARALNRPASSLADILLPEQIDSIAFDLDATERNRGFLVGSLTGTGKGRIAAARIHIARSTEGKRVIVLTERPVGLGTLARDMANIGALNLHGGPHRMALLNANREIRDAAEGTVIFPKRSVQEVRDFFMPDGTPAWPEGIDVVMGTYSGFNRDAEDSWRSAWLEHVVNRDVTLVLDEAHNVASAESKSAENLVNAIAAAGHTMYLSATYAPSGDKTGPYFSLIAPNADAGLATLLPRTVSNAGEAGHEEFGNLLVRDGAMVRFEHSFEEIDFRLQVSKNVEANREQLDRLAPVIREMLAYSQIIKRVLVRHNITHIAALKTRFDAQRDRLADLVGNEREAAQRERNIKDEWDRTQKNGKFRSMSFGSPLYRIQRAFNAAVMVTDPAGIIAGAIDHLQNGRKPTIVVDQTSEATITEVQEMARQAGIEAPVPTFKHLLKQILKSMGHAVNQNAERIDVQNLRDPIAEERTLAAEIIDMICTVAAEEAGAGTFKRTDEDAARTKPAEKMREWLDDAVPAVIEGVAADQKADRKAGLSAIVGVAIEDAFTTTATDPVEIIAVIRQRANVLREKTDLQTPRQNLEGMINALPDLPISFIDEVKHKIIEAGFTIGEITGRSKSVDRNGNIVPRKPEMIESVRDKFNRGEYDAAILNSAGASMIDLHSAAHFQDQRQRVLMILQIPPASTLVQILGRFHRIGQVIPPIVEMHINGMPTEVRFIANMNANLARMNANLASIRKHPLMCEAVPPLLTHDGDVATARVLLANPKIVEELAIDIPKSYLEKLANPEGVQTGEEEDRDALEGAGNPTNWYQSKSQRNGIKSFTRSDNRRIANEVLSRASILSSAAQSDLLREIQTAYAARIEEREALGLDTTGVKMVEGRVTLRATRMLDIGDGDKPVHEQSAFRAPLRMGLVTIEQSAEPLRGRDVVALVNKAVTRGDDRKLSERITTLERFIRHAEEQADLGGALADLDRFQAERARKKLNHLSKFPIGSGLTIRHDGELLEGVVVGYQDHTDDPGFEVAVPGVFRPKMVYLGSIMGFPHNHKSWDGIIGEARRQSLKAFDQAGELSKIETRVALIGNNWAAVQQDLGKIVTWQNPDQTVTRAVLLPRNGRGRPTAVARFSSVQMYRQALEATDGGHFVQLPIMPWSNGIESAGVSVFIDFTQSSLRGNTAKYLGRFEILGQTTTEAEGKRRHGLFVAEQHLEAFLSAAGGLVTRLYSPASIEAIRKSFRDLAAERDKLADAEQITDPAARSLARRRARAAAKILATGVQIRQTPIHVEGPDKTAVIDQICSIVDQAYHHGLEARREFSIDINVRSKAVRTWLIEGGWAPVDLDGFAEVNPPPQPTAAPVQAAFADFSAPKAPKVEEAVQPDEIKATNPRPNGPTYG